MARIVSIEDTIPCMNSLTVFDANPRPTILYASLEGYIALVRSDKMIYMAPGEATSVQLSDEILMQVLDGAVSSKSASTTTNGAVCLESTHSANLDFFASPWIFHNGKDVADDMEKNMCDFLASINAAFIEDSVLCIKNVLLLGNLRQCGKKNHPGYMLALVWFWQLHPKTFLDVIAPKIAFNSCARDLLTLHSVVTFNRSYPVNRLWDGEQPDAEFGSKRPSIKRQEALIWKKLLIKYNVKSWQVVEQQSIHATDSRKKHKSNTDAEEVPTASPAPATLLRDPTTTSTVSPVEQVSPIVGTNGTFNPTWGGRKRQRVRSQKKNVWLHPEFKIEYQHERKRLHGRDYGLSGVAGTPENYKAFTDIVINFFVDGLENETSSGMVAKWAPTQDGSHDKSTKRVEALGLPSGWNGGIAQAIGFKLFGGLLQTSELSGETCATSKKFVMTKYNTLLSTMRRPWVPESLEGHISTAKESPVYERVCAQWRTYRRQQTQTTMTQKKKFEDYLEDVATGKAKQLTKGAIRPDTLLRACCEQKPFLHHQLDDKDSVQREIEAVMDWKTNRRNAVLQFETMMKDVRMSLSSKDIDMIVCSDVSGSMDGIPMEMCVALSLAISNGANKSSPYRNKVLTFNTECEVVELTTLEDKTIDRWDRIHEASVELKGANWGGSTNLESVFERISEIESTRVINEGDTEKPLILLVITDMQFDDGVEGGAEDMLKSDILNKMFRKVGLKKKPTIVYWDVKGSARMSFSASENTAGVVLVSGYSESIVKAISDFDFDDVSPKAFMTRALEGLPYVIDKDMVVD
jgi:hypothetical protein